MIRVLFFLFAVISVSFGKVQDADWQYVVKANQSAVVRKGSIAGVNRGSEPLLIAKDIDDYSAVLLQYDLSALDLTSSVSSVIWCAGTLEGSGGNPSIAVYVVGNDWNERSVVFDTMPEKIQRLFEGTLRQSAKVKFPLDVTDYLCRHMVDGKVSFLIEMRSASGFSKPIHLSGVPYLAIARQQTPEWKMDDLLKPIWTGAKIVNETILPTSYNEKPAEANLAFVPSKVISVKNYDLDKTYAEGVDYAIDGCTIRLTAASSIPFYKYTTLYPDNPNARPRTMPTLDGGDLISSVPDFFNKKQLAVTYEHDDQWSGPIPMSAEKQLPKSFQMLEHGEPFRLMVFGDSISVGASASSKCMRLPFMPCWSELVVDKLRQTYKSDIDFINPSLGGKTSAWGKETVNGLASFEKPDLVILGFGMNDGAKVPVENFRANIEKIMNSFRGQNPDVEFILLMSFQPNSRWRNLDLMKGYLAAFKKMEGPGVAVADVWSLHDYLLKNKTYWDMTANHINHPNDFMVRVYAQVVLATLGVE